jgi:hypothetical protein
MHFSEDDRLNEGRLNDDGLNDDRVNDDRLNDDLARALRPVDPGPAFTQRVMARVSQLEQAKAAAARRKAQRFAWLKLKLMPHWMTVRPAWTAAVAALVLVIGIGLGYQQYERVQQQKRAIELANQIKAKEAERQVMLALRITSAKLNHVFKRVNEPLAPEQQGPRIRRQSL